jgi:hypothetical protein
MTSNYQNNRTFTRCKIDMNFFMFYISRVLYFSQLNQATTVWMFIPCILKLRSKIQYGNVITFSLYVPMRSTAVRNRSPIQDASVTSWWRLFTRRDRSVRNKKRIRKSLPLWQPLPIHVFHHTSQHSRIIYICNQHNICL